MTYFKTMLPLFVMAQKPSLPLLLLFFPLFLSFLFITCLCASPFHWNALFLFSALLSAGCLSEDATGHQWEAKLSDLANR